MQAKCGELASAGIPYITDAAAKSAISKAELSRHCRRRTRGEEKTIQLVEELLLSLSTATDPLGVPILKEEMTSIWDEQKQYAKCIQDPTNFQLYTITEEGCALTPPSLYTIRAYEPLQWLFLCYYKLVLT